MDKYAIVVAGGKGTRMGADVPKQFIELDGKPLLMHTLRRLKDAVPEVKLILVLPADQHDFWHELCEHHRFTLPHMLTTGGATRFHSVLSGLNLVPEGQETLVAVHDGVRPFVGEDVVRACYKVAADTGAAVPVVPVVETVREIGGSTLDRSRLRLVQTPQVFRLSLLRRAYEQPYTERFTDDASVVEAIGHAVTLVDGNRENIKITTPFDLCVAQALLRRA